MINERMRKKRMVKERMDKEWTGEERINMNIKDTSCILLYRPRNRMGCIIFEY